MKVIRGWSTDSQRNLMDPLLEKNFTIFFEWRGGDILDPISIGGWGGTWFGPKYPKRFLRAFVKWPILPFFAWRFKGKGGYLGWKAYGADSEHYLQWMPAGDVYAGSQALCLSLRPFATMRD